MLASSADAPIVSLTGHIRTFHGLPPRTGNPPQRQSVRASPRSCAGLAAAPEPTLAHRITGLLAFEGKLHIGHDRLVGMVGPPMRDLRFVIGNADHQTRRSRGPIYGR